jgi:hypothetical protein
MQRHSAIIAIVAGGIAGLIACVSGAVPSEAAGQAKPVSTTVVVKRAAAKPDSVHAPMSVRFQDSLNKAGVVPRRDSLSQTPRSFKVVTDPDSAAVFLDDSLKGWSPCLISGAAHGSHILTLKKKGYYLKKAEIAVDSTLAQELSFVLLKPAFLRIISDPAGAMLALDGKGEGVTPYENNKVKPGDHVVKVTLTQYVPVEQTVSVKSGGSDTLRFALEHTAAYKDSVAAVQQTAEKLKKERSMFSIVSALFCLCGVILVVIEASNQ